MKSGQRVRLELANPRYPDREIRERVSELISYARYAGIDLSALRKAIDTAKLEPGAIGLDMRFGGRLVLEVDQKTADLVHQVVQMYPVFTSWDIKTTVAKSGKAGKPSTKKKKETSMATAKKAAAKKKPAAKKKAVAKKPAAKKKAAAKKPAAKKKAVAKKAAAKKPAAKKKAAAKKPAAKKKAAAKKPAAKKKAAAKKPAAKKKAAKK